MKVGVSIVDLVAEARRSLAAVEEGEELDAISVALLRFAVRASVTSLDQGEIEAAVVAALTAGASAEQLTEMAALVSGLGVHSLMATMHPLLHALGAASPGHDGTLPDAARRRLWEERIGDAPYWKDFSRHFPGFLDATLQLSPPLFEAFLDYCALPWRMDSVPAVTKELAAMACDMTPGHRFAPGFKLHLANAIALGAGRRAVEAAMAAAADAPPHIGYGK
jgi:alkylhydroperoxidase/carboxymuconolactone decarboxylase family protein YurZ